MESLVVGLGDWLECYSAAVVDAVPDMTWILALIGLAFLLVAVLAMQGMFE